MNRSNYRMTLDIQNTHGTAAVDVKRLDTGRRLLINLTDGGRPYRLESDCQVVFTAKKPDGTTVYNLCSLQDNTVICDLTRQTTAVCGGIRCELRIYGVGALSFDQEGRPIDPEEGRLLTSAAFDMQVHDRVCTDEEVIASAPEASVLESLVGSAQDLIQQVQEKLDSGALTGPQGEKGDKGDQGEKGEKGDKGDQGEPGALGIDDQVCSADSTWSSQKISQELQEQDKVIVTVQANANGNTGTASMTGLQIRQILEEGKLVILQDGDYCGMYSHKTAMAVIFSLTVYKNNAGLELRSYNILDDGSYVVTQNSTAAVCYTAQTLLEKNQAQARANIGAAHIDDAATAEDATWSSQKIADAVAAGQSKIEIVTVDYKNMKASLNAVQISNLYAREGKLVYLSTAEGYCTYICGTPACVWFMYPEAGIDEDYVLCVYEVDDQGTVRFHESAYLKKTDFSKTVGDIETALDSIIAIQEELIGGESA